MDRRDFLKTSAICSGALLVGQSCVGSSKTTKQLSPTTDIQVKDYVNEPAKRIPVIDSADVVVLGGGPAGVSAAVAAARTGADVLLLEKQYYLGGLWTGCCVLPIINTCGCTKAGDWEKCIAGFAQELVTDLSNMNMCIEHKGHPTPDPEATKYVLEKYISESNVRLLYNCYATDVIMSGDRIDTLIVESKSGRIGIKGKVFVDCSGDGDILEWTGEDFEHRKLNIGAMWLYGNAENLERSGVFPTAVKGVKLLHMGGEKNQDGLNIYNTTRLQMKYRKQLWETAMKDKEYPGCEDLFLLNTPDQLGVRITRVMNAVHNVTFADSLSYSEYDDCIGFSGGDSSIKYKNGTEKFEGRIRPIWQIPYRSLTPKRVHNLLVAGRCFGFDEGLTYDAREIGTCLVTGQAAGTAAAMSAMFREGVRDINISDLQKRLKEQGVKL